jgi:hypothetical protein
MKALFLKFLTIITLLLTNYKPIFCQITATWQGGTVGKANDWFCPKNWKEGRVPNEFSNVIIPDVSSQNFKSPIIEAGIVEVNDFTLHSNASITIKSKAQLVVYGTAIGIEEGQFFLEGKFNNQQYYEVYYPFTTQNSPSKFFQLLKTVK